MAKKKKSEIPPFVKFGLICLCVIAVSFVIINRTFYAFKHVDYFNIQSVDIDPSLQFINKRDLRGVKGKNIFAVDIKEVQRQLSHKFPQASELKVNRRFPNQISVIAKQRMPFVQIRIQDQFAVLDKEGVILSLQNNIDRDLPDIVGTKLNNPKIILGLPLRGPDLSMALKIIRLFVANDSLEAYRIAKINTDNLSKIYCTLNNGIDFIIDREKMAQKIRVLGIVLAQDHLTLKDIQYVDLRFKEPIVGKK